MKKVLVTDGVHPLLLEGLENLGYQCDYHPKISLERVREMVSEYEGLIINSKILVDKTMLDDAKRLQFVGRLGSGMEIVDLEYAAQKGVSVHRAPEGNCNAVGEHALGMLLALANNFLQADREVRNKNWQREKNRGFEIMGRTIGIIGFGHTGSQFAKKLSGMGMNILAFDKYKKNYTHSFSNVKETTLEDICAHADIISLHLPFTPETNHLVDFNFYEKCKKGVIIINTSRGSVVKTEDLIAALKSGKVGGACLDVFENEKPHLFSQKENERYQELYEFENTIFTPHVAGWTVESKRRLAEVLLRKITEEYCSSL
ncbi:MAG TPA: phosphoglycerate dehydrogenase [Phaeodactylibacter sp.]|nr:phosphoglycerate dehydrogenase [Phaeodactylibacter sp.]